MRKTLLVISLVLLTLIFGCIQQKGSETSKTELSELQIEACNTADKAGTCTTRLEEIGIVTKEDCCEVLEKCC